MRTRQFATGITLCVVSFAALLSACNKPPTTDQNAGGDTVIIKIGHAAPLTGPQAHIGKDNEYGAQLAIDDANAVQMKIGGKKAIFQLIKDDDQADPKQGTLIAQKFVDEKVSAVVGHLNSGTTIPASKIYSDNGIPQVSPSATNVKYTHQGFKNTFRVMANDEQQGRVLGNFAASDLNAKTVAVIDDKTQYGAGIADEFVKAAEAAGVKILAREHTDDKSFDFSSILTSVKSAKPDLIFYGGIDPQAVPMAKQIKALGIKAKFLLPDGGCTTAFIQNAGADGANSYCSLPGLPYEKMSGGPAFIKRYHDAYRQDIQLYAPYAYDAVLAIIDAVQRADSAEPAKIMAALPATDKEGVATRIRFDKNGDIRDGAITLYQAQSGKWVPMTTVGGAMKVENTVSDATSKSVKAKK